MEAYLLWMCCLVIIHLLLWEKGYFNLMWHLNDRNCRNCAINASSGPIDWNSSSSDSLQLSPGPLSISRAPRGPVTLTTCCFVYLPAALAARCEADGATDLSILFYVERTCDVNDALLPMRLPKNNMCSQITNIRWPSPSYPLKKSV